MGFAKECHAPSFPRSRSPRNGSIWGCQTEKAIIVPEHEALIARNKMSNHTNMQEKYCGDYEIHSNQSHYTKGWRPPQKSWRGLRFPLYWL